MELKLNSYKSQEFPGEHNETIAIYSVRLCHKAEERNEHLKTFPTQMKISIPTKIVKYMGLIELEKNHHLHNILTCELTSKEQDIKELAKR